MSDSTCDLTDVGCHFTFWFDELKIFFVSIYGWFTDGLLELINGISLPDFLTDMPTYTIPDSIAYYASLMQLENGLIIISSAYGLRFLIRRIPFIG